MYHATVRPSLALACLAASLLPGTVCCTSSGPPDPPRADDLRAQYHQLQQQALTEVRAFTAGAATADPRPIWADRLETFALQHTGSEVAGEAFRGALQIRSASLDVSGFFRVYDLMLEKSPDAAGLSETFSDVLLMRMVEAVGPVLVQHPGLELRRRAHRLAAPKVAADMKRALAASSNPATQAAAHNMIATISYQLDVNPSAAREHFNILAEKFPDSLFAASARQFAAEIERLGAGRPAPDFEAPLLSGGSVRLSSQRGRVVLLDFWATWCQPCLEELPDLKRAYQRFRSRGFTILGVSLDEDPDAVRRFVKAHRITWPVVTSPEGTSGAVAREYAVQAIPMSYLVDRDGTIRGRSLFGSDVERKVQELLEAGGDT